LLHACFNAGGECITAEAISRKIIGPKEKISTELSFAFEGIDFTSPSGRGNVPPQATLSNDKIFRDGFSYWLLVQVDYLDIFSKSRMTSWFAHIDHSAQLQNADYNYWK
jgi:hypothetical protein